jgi:hypothetical protein
MFHFIIIIIICAYAANAVGKDLDIFAIGAISLNHIYTQIFMISYISGPLNNFSVFSPSFLFCFYFFSPACDQMIHQG